VQPEPEASTNSRVLEPHTLERQYGWDRTRLDGLDGAWIWTGHGVLAHNLVKIAALAA
jgi:transposase, IS5 family